MQKSAVYPVHQQWRYCSLTLNNWYDAVVITMIATPLCNYTINVIHLISFVIVQVSQETDPDLLCVPQSRWDIRCGGATIQFYPHSKATHTELRLRGKFHSWVPKELCIWNENSIPLVMASHKSHNALVKLPTMNHFVTEMCTFML